MWLAIVIGYVRFVWQLVSGSRLASECDIATWRARDIAPLLDPRRCWRVLDLANGRLRPQYSLLRAAGQRVCGIDLANRSRGSWVDAAYRVARGLYNAKILSPREQSDDGALVCGDVGALPFPSDCFDLVTSVAAFEHFLDVPKVVAELAHVVQPGGVVWVCIHPFTSPSGGHNLGFVEIPLRHVPYSVEPWDHLRKRHLPFKVPLNEWRLLQYREVFARYFEIVNEYCAVREGEHLLTPELQKELSAFDRDELTCGAYVIVARKTANE